MQAGKKSEFHTINAGYNEQKTHCVDKYLKQTYSLTLLLCFCDSVQVIVLLTLKQPRNFRLSLTLMRLKEA